MSIRHTQQRERAPIFQELSDSIAHMLYSLCIHLSLLDTQIEASLQAKRSPSESQAFAQQAFTEICSVRGPCQPLVPNHVGLAEVLQSLVWMAKSIGMQIDLHIDAPLPPLPLPLETTLYQLVHEILSRAVQHAPAASASIHLSVVDNAIQLTLLFNERLLAALFPPKTGQLVLFRMQAQVEEMGGRYTLRCQAARELEMVVSLPLLL